MQGQSISSVALLKDLWLIHKEKAKVCLTLMEEMQMVWIRVASMEWNLK